ncbi:MAG: hypothetical protein WAQ05_11210, partial [Rubrivivax sp.]
MTAPLHTMGVADLGRALRSKQLSSSELTQHLLDRLAIHADLGTALASSRSARAIWAGPSVPVASSGGLGTPLDRPTSATGPRRRSVGN